MKKLLLFTLVIFALLNPAKAQTYYKLNHKQEIPNPKSKTGTPNISVTFSPITYSQFNFQTSFLQIALNQGAFSVSPTTLQFTPSYVLGSANSLITITSQGDTIYKLSQVLAYGAGVTISENIITGKMGTAPSLIGQISNYAIVVGYDVINKQAVAGISTTISDLPFINKLTSITIKK